MAVTIKQTEAEPVAYPDAPEGLSAAAAALEPAVVWERLESFVAHRWSSRAVVWMVEGPGEWSPPLSPAAITKVEIWAEGTWTVVTPDPSPLGYWLPGNGPYRFTGTAGAAEVPPTVLEAYRRLAEYMAAKPGTAGASSERIDVQDIESRQVERSATWMARSMANSGAADLLRAYRRA